MIRLDVASRSIDLLIEDAEFERRRALLPPGLPQALPARGYAACSTRPCCKPTRAAISISWCGGADKTA